MKLGRSLRIERVTYINPTGLAENASAHADIRVIKGASTLIANWSTDSDLPGTNTIPANTPMEIPITSVADADEVIVGGEGSGADTLSVFFDMTGTVTLPAGKLVIEGHFVAG